MKFFNKKPADKPFSSRIMRRVNAHSSQELIGMVDTSLYSIGRLASAYQRSNDPNTLDELLLSVEALHAMVDTVKTRTKFTNLH